MDRQTDRRTDRIAISTSRVSVLTRDKILKVESMLVARCYASAALAVMRSLSVRLSVLCVCVRQRRSWILSKRINISSKFYHRRVATSF